MKRSRLLLLAVLSIFTCFTAAGCDGIGKRHHEPISICAPGRYVRDFINVVHKYYPEITFDVDAYNGNNATDYMLNQFRTDNLPDIYSMSYYIGDHYDLSDRLVDLSKYAFTGNYVPARLRDVNENGSVYLLPSYYSCMGITYNKKILRDNGWSLPTSFEELKELAPKVKEKQLKLALNEIGLPGYGFQYLCNILDTDYLSTTYGRKWQRDFLSGKTTFSGDEKMRNALNLLDEWRDIGMLNGDMKESKDTDVATKMSEGETLFLLGMSNNVGSSEDYGLMPYLSMDGKQNVYILSVTRYMGINKKLEEKGNEQKLEDALHVMEILSTDEGMQALNRNILTTNISPLKNTAPSSNSYYKDIMDDINNGFTAPFIYSGWDNVIVEYGNEVISYICGEKNLDEIVQYLDDNQHLLTEEPYAYTEVTETLNQDVCGKLVGIAFAKATGSDLALMSLGGMDPDTGSSNSDGVNGQLFPMKISEQEVSSITPTGWYGNIHTVTLTGKRVKELAKSGYNRRDRGYYFPYVLAQKEGTEIQDDRTYKVAICGMTDAVKKEGNDQDSGVVGLQALKDYLETFDTLSPQKVRWEE